MKMRAFNGQRSAIRGFAALTLVMVLFFIMALVAAYTNRNLIFEQRISANNYRGSKALNAVEGGLDWTLAMLNGGRIDKDCKPSTKTTDSDFRRRYYTDVVDPAKEAGSYQCSTGSCIWATDSPHPACISRDGVMSCSCPTVANPDSTATIPSDGIGSTFRVSFILPGAGSHQGAVKVFVQGCANPGTSSSGCLQTNDFATVNVDTLSMGVSTLGLVRALPVPPKATLTAGHAIVANAGVLNIGNGDDASGLTAHAPIITVNAAAAKNFRGPAGSGGDGEATDPVLGTLRGLDPGAPPSSNWFNAMFGMPIDLFKRQPALVTCPGNCDQDALLKVISAFPRNPIWVEGDLTLGSDAIFGTATDPVMLIVTGTLTISAKAQITGFVHANNVAWSAAASNATLIGAMVASTDFTSAGTATLNYNKAVIDIIRLRYGSFVRAPGGWDIVYERPPA
jgi:hypothetical protein